ncbi:MAG: universal stress protein [Pirellulales bacterium]|nr:universal stress protein [Pirellulales bacterium]
MSQGVFGQMIKRILVGLGSLDYARSATAKAIELAKNHQATLTGVTLFDVDRLDLTGPVPIGAGQLAKELRESRHDSVSSVIEAAEVHFSLECKKADVEYRLQRETGDPLEALVSLTRYHDLVVCGLQSLFEHGVIDDPPDELAMLVKEGVRPLLAVTDKDQPIRRVLIAYSGSMESAKTMRRFIHLRMWPDAELRVVTFHQRLGIGETLLQDAADYCRAHGFEPETEYIPKPPLSNLLPYATDWKADLIVLGNSAKNMLLRRILGETALHVMRNADLPLFLAQ